MTLLSRISCSTDSPPRHPHSDSLLYDPLNTSHGPPVNPRDSLDIRQGEMQALNTPLPELTADTHTGLS